MEAVGKNKRTNRFKIKCLECKTILDNDHRKKHNERVHADLIKQRKSIRWEVLNAPKNPFFASSRSKPITQDNIEPLPKKVCVSTLMDETTREENIEKRRYFERNY